jgi:hypothetical protein
VRAGKGLDEMHEEMFAFLMIGIVAVAGFIYAAYKRTLEYDLKKAELRNSAQGVQELKRQVETLQAIVTASDYEARRRLLAHLPANDERGRVNDERTSSDRSLTVGQ